MKDNKPTNKNQNYNDEILETLSGLYGYSVDYIRKCLRGDRKGLMPDKLVAEYKRIDKASKKAIKDAASQPISK